MSNYKDIFESIDGVGNLCCIKNFINMDKIIDIDVDASVEYTLRKSPAEIPQIDIDQIIKNIHNIFKEYTVQPKNIGEPIIKNKQKSVLSAPAISTVASSFLMENIEKKPIIEEKPVNINPSINTFLYSSPETFDEKFDVLQKITSLKTDLLQKQINISNIPDVNENSSLTDIKQIYRILTYKKDASFNHEMARDYIMIGINALESYFDGSETSWGRKPNLTGWNRTAKMKLVDMKSELGSIVSDLMKAYNLGPLAKILFSLVPSAFLHAITVGNQKVYKKKIENNNDINKIMDMK